MTDQAVRRLLPSEELAAHDVDALAAAAGWNEEARHEYAAGSETVWSSPGGGVIRWIRDDVIGLRYFQAAAPHAGLLDALRAHVVHFTAADLLAELEAQPSDERASALLRGLGVLAHADEQDARIVAAFERAFRDPAPIVRYAAVLAAMYPGWRSFEPQLRALLDDGEPDVARVARDVLDALAHNRWKDGV